METANLFYQKRLERLDQLLDYLEQHPEICAYLDGEDVVIAIRDGKPDRKVQTGNKKILVPRRRPTLEALA